MRLLNRGCASAVGSGRILWTGLKVSLRRLACSFTLLWGWLHMLGLGVSGYGSGFGVLYLLFGRFVAFLPL